jgi:5-methylcytosine-specific restriction enzyme A
MGLAMRFDEGLWCPVIECDVCGRRIFGEGAYLWWIDGEGISDGRIWFAHKGECHERCEAFRPTHRGLWLWIEIDELPEKLTWNLGYEHEAVAMSTWRDLRDKARWGMLPKVQRSSSIISDGVRDIVLRRDQVCRMCGSDARLQVDHIIPLARGGNSSIENLQTLCLVCNVRKGARLEV